VRLTRSHDIYKRHTSLHPLAPSELESEFRPQEETEVLEKAVVCLAQQLLTRHSCTFQARGSLMDSFPIQQEKTEVVEKAVDCLRIITTGNDANKRALVEIPIALPGLMRLLLEPTAVRRP